MPPIIQTEELAFNISSNNKMPIKEFILLILNKKQFKEKTKLAEIELDWALNLSREVEDKVYMKIIK